MQDVSQANANAKALCAALREESVDITHARALEIVARQFGFANWNVFSAKMKPANAKVKIRCAAIASGPLSEFGPYIKEAFRRQPWEF